jgi:hypothetical protein
MKSGMMPAMTDMTDERVQEGGARLGEEVV